MATELCLPLSTRKLLKQVSEKKRHPGLQLDKFSIPGDQKQQRGCLDLVCQTRGESSLLKELHERRTWCLQELGARQWSCQTTGPLTLHLSRASALENAGICLHPLYGFVYLPGSGLKGMARAYAETVWLPTQFTADDDRQPRDNDERQKATHAWRRIEAVFGWAPGSDEKKEAWKPQGIPKRGKDEQAHAGGIVFHDAWPEKWPTIQLDIVNNHHAEYYKGEDSPGDWEEPNMVSFLAIGSGETFSFAISKRRAEVDDELLALAQEWLTDALCHLGAGAKTAAGYGSFKPVEGMAPTINSPARLAWETTLELVSPAFLSGPLRTAEDCDLRPATLRGLLRWWWRTMHAGYVDLPTLRRLEAAVWGNTDLGGAVRITVEHDPSAPPQVVPAPFKKIGTNKSGQKVLEYDDSFGTRNKITKVKGMTTQPLLFLAYGMDEMKTGDIGSRNQRHCVFPGAKWSVRLVAKSSWYEVRDKNGKVVTSKSKCLSAQLILKQAQAALWLLCHYGGVGSKARKGFGSFADIECLINSLQGCQEAAAKFRDACGVPSGTEQDAESPALGKMIEHEQPIPWTNPWYTLDKLGEAVQSFAQADKSSGHGKHCVTKLALGLPRQIHGPLPYKLPHQKTWTSPQVLTGPKGDRHAAPVHYHLAKRRDGTLSLRMAAFPAAFLPDTKTSRAFLTDLRTHLVSELGKLITQHAKEGRAPVSAGAAAITSTISPDFPKPGERVEAELLPEKTKKGGWRAKLLEHEMAGAIQNWREMPPDLKPGDNVTLIVAYARDREIGFRWPPADK